MIFDGYLTQAELAARGRTDLSRVLANHEQANAPKSKRRLFKLHVRDGISFILFRDIAEVEKQRRKTARNSIKMFDEMKRQDQIKEQDNQRRERELSWVTRDDRQPLYCIDTQGVVL